MFFISSGSFTITNCTMDDMSSKCNKEDSSFVVQSTPKDDFIVPNKHLETANCFASYLVASGIATPAPDFDNTPVVTATFVFRRTCNDHIKGPVIEVMRILEFIFLLSILPSDPARDVWYDYDSLEGPGFWEL